MKTRHPGIEVDISFVPADPSRARTLTPAQVTHFNERGYIADLPVMTASQAGVWREYVDANRKKFSDFSGGFRPFHHVDPGLYDLVTRPNIVGWMRDLLGEDVVCHSSQYITKDPGDPHVIAWHQDCSYNPMDARCVVIWIAFEDVDPTNGGMWFIPGSHLLGQLEFDQRTVLETRDPEAYGKPIPLPLKAGQAVIFSDQLLHMSRGNTTTDRQRRSFNATYANAALKPALHKGDWAVLCSGRPPHDLWKLHARPDGAGVKGG